MMNISKLKFYSLFAGIGGFDLGLVRAGLVCVGQVENDPFCIAVLEDNFPNVPRYDDIKHFDFDFEIRPDLICGGFPCQDLSSANIKSRTGLAGSKSGLWKEFYRVVRQTKPRWVIVENVASGWKQWVPKLRRDLWRIGYASMPIQLRACDFGAPHKRNRIFLVAHTDRDCKSVLRVYAKMAELPRVSRFGRYWKKPPSGGFRLANGVPHCVDRNKALGNAVVPQIAEALGYCIREVD